MNFPKNEFSVYSVVLISFPVVFGVLVFGSSYESYKIISSKAVGMHNARSALLSGTIYLRQLSF